MTEARVADTQLYELLICPSKVLKRRDAPVPEAYGWSQSQEAQRSLQGLGIPWVDLSALPLWQREQATREAMTRREALIVAPLLTVHELVAQPFALLHQTKGYTPLHYCRGAPSPLAAAALNSRVSWRRLLQIAVPAALSVDLLQRMSFSAGASFGLIFESEAIRWFDLHQHWGQGRSSLWESYLKARAELWAILAEPEAVPPALTQQCRACQFRTECRERLVRESDLTLLPGVGRRLRAKLQEEFPTLWHLARADLAVLREMDMLSAIEVGEATLRRLHCGAQRLLALHKRQHRLASHTRPRAANSDRRR